MPSEPDSLHTLLVFDSTSDAIVTFNRSKRIELFNLAAEALFQCARAEVVGASFERFLTKGLHQALEASLAEFDRSADARPRMWSPGGLFALSSDGHEFPIDVAISRAKASEGDRYTLILRTVDKTAQKIPDLAHQAEYLEEQISAAHNFEEIVGQSPALHTLLKQVSLVAPTDSTVLLLGETGTGKELMARAIHSHSLRKNRPLIGVNCSALPTGLIDSKLFGHEKGAFTGAITRRVGRFELAQGGSIFLDEVADMSAEAQAKLLRVLQEHEVERLGGNSVIKVDVRVIAAANRDLQEAVTSGSFREDLYYRLSVFPLRVPPLRERMEDIPLLVHHFLRRYASKIGRRVIHVPVHVISRLVEYSWPGNVRELENVIERAVIMSKGPALQLDGESLPLSRPPALTNSRSAASSEFSSPGSEDAKAPTALAEVERNHILVILERAGWRIEGPNGAAHALDLKPSTLRSRMKKFGISRKGNGA